MSIKKGLLFFIILLFLIRLSFLQIRKYPINAKVKITTRVKNETYHIASKQIIKIDQIKVVADQFPTVLLGDKIEVIGTIKSVMTKNDRANFYLYPEKILILDPGKEAGFWLKARRFLVVFRCRLEDKFGRVLPEPETSLLSGILLGAKTDLPESFFDNLQKTGTLHLVAASGFNVNVVVAAFIFVFTLVFTRKVALFFSFLGVIAYTLMAGASPAVVRAAIMGSMTYLAQFLGRYKDAVLIFFITIGLMLFVNPLLYLDIGFQLSVGATAGILFLFPVLKTWSFFEKNWTKEIGLTLVAQTVVLPIVLYHFGTFSFFSPLVNGLVGPLVPWIMKLGAPLGLIPADYATIFTLPVWVLLTFMVKIIDFFGAISFGSLQIEKFPFWAVVVYYLGLVVFYFKIKKRTKSKE